LSVSILKQAGHDVPEEKNEPPEERALFCDINWLFDLEFLLNVNDHLKSSEYQSAEQESIVSFLNKSYQCIQDEVKSVHFAVRK